MYEVNHLWVLIVGLSFICLFLCFMFSVLYSALRTVKKRSESYENTLIFFAKTDVFYMDQETMEPVKCSGMAETILYFHRPRKMDSLKLWNNEINRDFIREIAR
jgi:hypothetical protein